MVRFEMIYIDTTFWWIFEYYNEYKLYTSKFEFKLGLLICDLRGYGSTRNGSLYQYNYLMNIWKL